MKMELLFIRDYEVGYGPALFGKRIAQNKQNVNKKLTHLHFSLLKVN